MATTALERSGYSGPVVGYSGDRMLRAAMAGMSAFGRVLSRDELGDPALLVVGPLPPRLARETPSIAAVVAWKFEVARLRFYAPGTAGEWFVLGLDEDRATAWCFGISPLEGRVDGEHVIDLAQLGTYERQYHVDRIVWDPDFAPAAYDAERLRAGRHPVQGRELPA